MSYIKIRMVVSTLLLITSTILLITGIILYLKSTHVLYIFVRRAPARGIGTLHTYLGFTVAGLALIHVYLNWPVLKSYFKRRGKYR